MKKEKKNYKTVASHISLEIASKLENMAKRQDRSVSHVIGKILEAYVKPTQPKEGK